MARAYRDSSRSFRRKEEEEEKQIAQPEQPEPKAEEPPQPEAPSAEPMQAAQAKQPKQVTLEKTESGVKANVGPTNRQTPGMTDLMAANAYKEASTQLVNAGALDQLPPDLADDADALAKKAEKDGFSPKMAGRWSSESNKINVDYGSIKNDTHAMYFAMNLSDDKQKAKFFKGYAEHKGLDEQGLLYSAEQMFGNKLFSNPQSNKGKLTAVGLYNPDGTTLDMNTAKAPEALRALRMVPDDHPGKAAAIKAYKSEFGWIDDSEFKFLDSAALTESDYNKTVKKFQSAFAISDGATDENDEAYLAMLDEIDYMYGESPAWVKAQLKSALDREYSERTGVLPPDENALRTAAEQAASTPEDEGEKKGPLGRAFQFVKDLFAGTDKAPEAEEEEEPEEPKDLRSGVSAPTYYASATVSSGGASAPEVMPSEATAAEPAEVQGPVFQPQAAQEAPVQENAQTYVNAVAYDPEMTDAQALAQWKRGATLDPRNMEQIAWFTGSRNAQGITGGTGMYSTVMDESGRRKAIDVYSFYGNEIGAAINAINSGNLPEDIQNTATLDLGSAIDELDRIIADPRNGITIPQGQNAYEYVLRMPQHEHLLGQVRGVADVQKQVNDAYAEQALREKEAQLAQIERDKAAVASGNATPDVIKRLAEATTATDYVNLYDDNMYARLKAQMNPMRIDYFGDDKAFWQNGSAAAQEGQNIKALGGDYGLYKSELLSEVGRVLDDYTETALMIGMTLEEYLGSAGIGSLDQIADIAYNDMLARGNAYSADAEAQEAAATIATTSDATWGEAALMGAESGVKSYAADMAQTAYMALDEATYNLERADIMNQYIEDYGYEYAAARYYNDLMAYANSGKMDEASKQDLLYHMKRARNIFDVAFEIDASGIEGWARTTNYELQKDVDALAEIAQTLPRDKRMVFDLTSSAVNSLTGMAVSTAFGGVTGSAIVGSAIAYGAPEWASAYDENRAKGMSPGMSGWMALGNALLTTAANQGGTGSSMEIFFGDEMYKTFYHALQSESGVAFIKAFAKSLAGKAHEEGMEEVAETVYGKAWDLLDAEAIAIDNGEEFSLSRTLESMGAEIASSDPKAVFQEIALAYGMGAAMGGVFALAGTTKTAVQARRGVNAQKKYASIEQAVQIAEGKIAPTEDVLGEVYTVLQQDLQDPKFRRWIDSAAKAAKNQRATVTAIMGDAGSVERHAAVAEAQKVTEYTEKAVAATEAAQNATSRWIELRQQVASGDLSKVASMESARMLMGKANTAKQEATTALEKAKESAKAHMDKWLAAALEQSGVYKSQEMERRANQLNTIRAALAKKLNEQYEAEEAARQKEIDYAEDQIFQDEEWQEDEEIAEIENMTDDELDEEIVDINSQIADAQERVAEVISRSEELGLDEETAQALVDQEIGTLNRRKEHIIAREKSRFNNAFERMQTALEMDDGDAVDQIAAEYDRIGERLSALGENVEALTAEQYGVDLGEANEAYEAAQEQEAARQETEKQERLTDDLSRRMGETATKLMASQAVRKHLAKHPIYVNESQAADILHAEGLKSIPQFNRRYGTKLTTDKGENAMPLDGHVMNDINAEAAGSVDESADPVSELLRIMQTGKELAAEQKAQKAEAKELAEKKKAAGQKRRERVDAVVKPIKTEEEAIAANGEPTSAISVTPQHTSRQQKEILSYRAAVDLDVLNAAQSYKNDPGGKNDRIRISAVQQREADDILNLTGFSVTGYAHTADRNFFTHVEKRHGENGEADRSMSDLNDVARVGWVLSNYDSVELLTNPDGSVRRSEAYLDGKQEHMPLLRYTKRLDGSVYVVEAAGESKWKKLWLVSAYIQKNGPVNQSQNQAVTQTPHAENQPLGNVQNANASPANTSVAQGSSAVNNNPNIDAMAAGGTVQTPAQKQIQHSKKLEGSALKTIQNLAKEMKVGLRVKSGQRFQSAGARLGSNVLGYYKNGQRNAIVRSSDAGRVSVVGHEIGHALQEQIGLSSNQQMISSWQNTFGNTGAYTPQQYDHEAFAEFFWRYLTDRNAAVAYAGDSYVDAFEQALRQKKLHKAVAKAQAQVSAYMSSEADAKIRARVVNASDAGSPEDTAFMRRVEIRLADDTAAAEDFQDVIRARKGEKHLSLEDNLRDAVRFNRRASARASECLTSALVDQNGDHVGESLKDALSDVKGKDFDLFWEYELAKHSLDRDTAKGAQNQVFDEETLSTADRQTFVAKMEREHPEFKQANERFQKWRRLFMDTYLVNNGFLGDPAQASVLMDALEAAYPNYVPTYRAKGKRGKGATIGGRRYQMRTATGSTEDIINPFDSFVSMVNSIVQMTADNDSRKKFADLYDRYGDPLPGETGPGIGLFANEITQDMQRVSVSTAGMREKITKLLDSLGTDPDVVMQIGDIIGDEKVEYHGTGRVNMNNVITVRNEDGSKRYFEVYNPELFELLAAANTPNQPGVLDMAAKATRMMSMLTTGSNPVFGLTNMMRDFQNSVNYGSWASSYADGAIKWIGALWDVVTNGEASAEYDRLGGGGWTAYDTKTKKGADKIRSEVFAGYNTSNVGRIGKMAGRAIWSIATMEKLNEAIEKTSRVAEYKYGKHDRTTTEGRIEAFLASQDVTTDFARRGNGQAARDLKNIIPFFNASMQGIYRTGRQLTAQESDRAGIRFAKTLVNTTLAAALANGIMLEYLDDDEKEEFFYLSDDLKAKHMFLPNFAPNIFGDAALIRVPLNQDPVMYAINAAVANFVWAGENDNEFVIEMSALADVILDNLNPVGSTIFDPAISMLSNKNWYGSNIVPTYLQTYETTNQYTEETPLPFVELSKILSGAGVKISPMMLQYVAEQYTGYIGQTLIPALPSEKNKDGIVSGALNALIATARKRVTSDPLTSNDVVSVVYDSYNALNAVYKAGNSKRDFDIDYLNPALSDREHERAIREADDLIHSGGEIYEAKKEISAGYDKIDQINGRNDLTDEEKHMLTQRVRREMVETALDVREIVEDYNARYKYNGIVPRWLASKFIDEE